MIKEYKHICRGTCSREITIKVDTETNKLVDFNIVGGCNGNLKGIKSLITNMDIDEIISKLDGIKCGFKPTSCPDQIALALKEIKNI